jgi:hypothetical protein
MLQDKSRNSTMATRLAKPFLCAFLAALLTAPAAAKDYVGLADLLASYCNTCRKLVFCGR